jgi:hypothetical protein
VKLCIEEEEHRTPQLDDAGSAPKWSGGSAHVFTPSEAATDLDVSVFDDDVGSDDLIGKCSFDLQSFGEEDGARADIWLDLKGAKGKKSGSVLLELFWTVQSKSDDDDDDDDDGAEEAPPPEARKLGDGYPQQHESIGPTRLGMTLEQATAYCARIPNCCGMWFEQETGRCEAMSIWNPHGTFVPMSGRGAFFQIKELPEVLYGPPIIATSMVGSDSVCFHSTLPLPNELPHLYAEVTFSHPTKEDGDMVNDGFFGLTNHDDTYGLHDISKNGAWGFRDDRDNEAVRIDGKASGEISPNAKGRGFSGGDRLGLLVDQPKCRVQFFRNGEMIDGAVAGGWEPGERMWLAACVPSRDWNAKWTFKAGYMPCAKGSTASSLSQLFEAAHQGQEEWEIPEADIKEVELDSDEEDEMCVHSRRQSACVLS